MCLPEIFIQQFNFGIRKISPQKIARHKTTPPPHPQKIDPYKIAPLWKYLHMNIPPYESSPLWKLPPIIFPPRKLPPEKILLPLGKLLPMKSPLHL